MVRIVRSVGVALALLSPAIASADGGPGRFNASYVTAPPQQGVPTGVLTGQVIYLNRCAPPGCDVKVGAEDASTTTSQIASQPAHWDEFAWMPGEWDAVVKCVKEVYSPYNVTVTDTLPQSAYNMEIIAGSPGDIGYDPQAGGVALVSSDCSPRQNSIAFAFTSSIDVFAQEDNNNRVWGMCWVAAQEIAHIYGLDHEYSWVDDGTPACNDPMTYRPNCGGQKFFRNRVAKCGEFPPQPRPGCGPNNTCSSAQNSHAKLINVFGEGTPITTPPVVSITSPTGGTVNNGAAIAVTASAQRGIALVELYINGHTWAQANGNQFDAGGQTNTSYSINLPDNVPDGVMDIMVKAYDDIQVETDSATVTVTKGQPCVDASTCAKGQLCDAGKCYWAPPTGQFGDKCDYPEFCTSGLCEGTADLTICTTNCVLGSTDACPKGYDCAATSATQGVCFPQASGGCCNIGSDSHAIYAHGLLALGVFGFVARRRRRRR
ncbi:MAG TPA: Ig-like domain-containing protein [Kofleriaceae bacterium]|nr:Ig-like domain-containing protein [Kofleriaceae bacterium]